MSFGPDNFSLARTVDLLQRADGDIFSEARVGGIMNSGHGQSFPVENLEMTIVVSRLQTVAWQ